MSTPKQWRMERSRTSQKDRWHVIRTMASLKCLYVLPHSFVYQQWVCQFFLMSCHRHQHNIFLVFPSSCPDTNSERSDGSSWYKVVVAVHQLWNAAITTTFIFLHFLCGILLPSIVVIITSSITILISIKHQPPALTCVLVLYYTNEIHTTCLYYMCCTTGKT